MKNIIVFTPGYDFSDDNFVRLKEEKFLELKTNFLQRLEKAREKPFVLENEKKILLEHDKQSIEVYGSILLQEFETCFKTGSKSIQEVIADFVNLYHKKRTEWAKMYKITAIQNNTEFRRYGEYHEFELLVLMTAWANKNKHFDGRPNKNNNCPVDITRTDAVHYFERLAEYQAEKEYGKYIEGFKNAEESDNSDKRAKDAGEYTIARQILAIRHVLIEFGMQEAYTNNSDIARLVHLLAGREVSKIANSPIYDRMKKLNATNKMDLADYQFVIRHFEKLNAPSGSGIDKIITRLKQDMK